MHTLSSRIWKQRRGTGAWMAIPLLATAMMFLALRGLNGVAAQTSPADSAKHSILNGIVRAMSRLTETPGSVESAAYPNHKLLSPSASRPSFASSALVTAMPAPRRDTPAFSAEHSLLDEVGRLAIPVPPTQIAAWKNELHAGTVSGASAVRLHLRLGEWALASDESPSDALHHLRTAAHMAPVTSPQHGQAMYEIAVTHFREGAYRQAADEFKFLVSSSRRKNLSGYNHSNCALFLRHALACTGYHEERSRLGIPEPPKLDPNCGAAGIAVCLRALKLPFDEKTMLASTRVTGLGSNLQDLIIAC